MSVEIIREMLEMQDAMNSRVHPQWRERYFEWYRAIWTECAELMDHIGWKWWKKQEPNMEQVKLELVDIWHFVMSAHLVCNDYDEVIQRINDSMEQDDDITYMTSQTLHAIIESMARITLIDTMPPIPLFWKLLRCVDMDINELHRLYVGKNVLNFFRQDNGYKEGTYIKVWNGREDNEYLAEILNGAPVGVSLQTYVREKLQEHYPG